MKWRLGNCSSRTIYGLWISCRHNRQPKCTSDREPDEEMPEKVCAIVNICDGGMNEENSEYAMRAHIIRSHPIEMLAWMHIRVLDAQQSTIGHKVHTWIENFMRPSHRVCGLSMGTRIIWSGQFLWPNAYTEHECMRDAAADVGGLHYAWSSITMIYGSAKVSRGKLHRVESARTPFESILI